MQRNYTKPTLSNKSITSKIYEYFKTKGISKETVDKFKITMSSTFFASHNNHLSCIDYNYYREDELAHIIHESSLGGKRGSENTEKIFYGLWMINPKVEHVVICANELDCMSFVEAGVENVIAIPSVAGSLDNINPDYSLIENKLILICTGHDDKGRKYERDIVTRFGEAACALLPLPEDCNHVNDVLVKYNVKVVKDCFESPEFINISGVQTVTDYEDIVDNYYMDGYPKGDRVKFSQKFNELLTWMPKQLTVVTGTPGSGKSEFLDQICCDLAEGINQDSISGGWQQEPWRFAMVSAETPPELHFIRLAEKVSKQSFDRMSEEELYSAKQFINDRFFWINNDDDLTVDFIIDKARQLKMRYGINCLVIDPYNCISHDFGNSNENNYISEFLNKMTNLAKRLDIAVIIVAHPTKSVANTETGKVRPATLYDVSGSSNWFNKTHNGISVFRDKETDEVWVIVQKVKYKYLGKLGRCKYIYNKSDGTYKEDYE